jgi:hypothetical protein
VFLFIGGFKMSYQDDTWNFLRLKGLPEKSTASVMGNIQMESGFDPNIIESGTGIGFGLCQWSYGRRTQLEAYGTDFQHQLNFLWSELTGEDLSITGADYQWINQDGYIDHDNFMLGNGTIDDLTSAFCFSWERPDPTTAHLLDRQNTAKNFYIDYTGQNPSSGNCKLIFPYWFGSNIKISYTYNDFILVKNHGNVVLIKNNITNRYYYVNKSSIKIV